MSIIFISSCDKIEEPYMVKLSNNNNIDTTEHFRKILVEDYTGHRCGNCPIAHEKLQELIGIYGNKLVPISMHVGFFAMPLNPYNIDYRTTAGDELNTYFGNDNAGLPNGMINRFTLGDKTVLNNSLWQQAIDSLLKLDLEADIKITNVYNSSSNSLNISVLITSLIDISSKIKLAVYLKEDSLISMQTWYGNDPVDIPNYTHRYVMRGAINSTWGDVVSETGMNKNQSITKTYSFTPKLAWKISNCSVVAFLYYDDTKIIIQADEKDI